MTPKGGRLPRPLLITALLSVAFLAWVWLFSGQIRQLQIILTYAGVGSAGLFVLAMIAAAAVYGCYISMGSRQSVPD